MESSVEEPKESKSDDSDELLSTVKSQFEEFIDGTISARALGEKCRAYKDGDQYTDDERAILKKRKQPCITDNKIQDKVDTLLGIEKQLRTDPKAYPRNPNTTDQGSAEACTDALRYIADQSCYHTSTRKPAADNLAVEGLCFGQVVVEKRGKKTKICMEHIRWDRGYWDIRSLRDDFEDKTYCGYFTWMDYDQAKREWSNKTYILEQCFSGESVGGSKAHDDKPTYTQTKNGRKRVQVFTHYFIDDGVWHECKWVKGGFLEDPQPATYKDEYGEPACCMEIQAVYRDSQGSPYGVVKRYLDLQDEHNKRRSKMLHLLNAKRIVVQRGALGAEPDAVREVRNQIHQPDGVIEVAGDISQFRVEDNLNEAQGQWQLLQQTEAALAAIGPNAALAGHSGNISGVAKARDQQGGMLSIEPLIGALDAWELRMYRQAWARVRQFWNAETWIRVTDNEDVIRFVPLNQVMTQGDLIAEQLKGDEQFQQLSPDEQKSALMELAQHPDARQPAVHDGKVMKKNEVATIDVDIIIDRAQDTITVQQEEFGMLAEIAKTRPEIPFEVIMEMSQLRQATKKKVIDKLSGTNDPQKAQMAQMQQKMLELEMMLKQATVEKVQSETAKNQAATNETGIDTSVKLATFTTGPLDAKAQVSVN